MTVKEDSVKTLQELYVLISMLDQHQYAASLPILSDSSIGKHIRHIVEFYQCLLNGLPDGNINYDDRKRDLHLEVDPEYTTNFISSLISAIKKNCSDQTLALTVFFGDKTSIVETTYFRELAYNIEHAIHHLAIIKIAIKTYFESVVLPPHFGIAYSTIQYHEQSAITKKQP